MKQQGQETTVCLYRNTALAYLFYGDIATATGRCVHHSHHFHMLLKGPVCIEKPVSVHLITICSLICHKSDCSHDADANYNN